MKTPTTAKKLMNKNLILITRWIGILPVAIASYFIVYAIMGICEGFATIDYDNNWWDNSLKYYLFPAIKGGVGAYCFVKLGVLCAPKYKKTIALILLILAILLTIGFILISFFLSHIKPMFEYVGNLVGCIIAYIQIKRHNNYEVFD